MDPDCSGFGFGQLDLSLRRALPITERFRIDVAAQGYNILNHPNFAGVSANLESQAAGIPAYTPDVNASNPVVGSGGSRHIQLGVKLIW